MSGQGFLKDFKAFGSRPSLAEAHFPLHFVDFLHFGELHDSDDSGGGGSHFRQFSSNGFNWISVRNQSSNQPGEEN